MNLGFSICFIKRLLSASVPEVVLCTTEKRRDVPAGSRLLFLSVFILLDFLSFVKRERRICSIKDTDGSLRVLTKSTCLYGRCFLQQGQPRLENQSPCQPMAKLTKMEGTVTKQWKVRTCSGGSGRQGFYAGRKAPRKHPCGWIATCFLWLVPLY